MTQAIPKNGGEPGPRKVRIKQVDAFTDTPLNGNPAGVVVDAAGLSDKQMQLIAREMSVPETAFILPATAKAADLRIRWFSPTVEIPLCGHATIASFHAMAEDSMHGMEREGSHHFTLETQSGNLPVTVERTAESTMVWMGLNLPEFKRATAQKLDVMRVLNLSLSDFDAHLPIVSDKYLYVPIRRLHTIFALQPNIFALSHFLTTRHLSGVCVFTTETVDRMSSAHSRFFAPHLGINEDPVTGSANGPLGVYLVENGALEENGMGYRRQHAAKAVREPAPPAQKTIITEQGDAIGRKGRVHVRLSTEGNKVTAVSIGGRAVTIFDGEMLLS